MSRVDRKHQPWEGAVSQIEKAAAVMERSVFPILALLLLLLSILDSLSALSLFQNKLLVRKLRSQPTNITLAWEAVSQIQKPSSSAAKAAAAAFMEGSDHPEMNGEKDPYLVAVEAIRVCGKAQKPDEALKIFQQFPSEPTRTMTISVLGGCHQHEQALALLESSLLDSPPSAASYNAAIAACGKAKDWPRAVSLFEEVMPQECKSTVTVNALLTVLANSKEGLKALEVYRSLNHDTSDAAVVADTVSHHLVMSALTRSGNLDEAVQLLDELEATKQKPSTALFDLLAAAYTQQSDWKGVERVEQLRQGNETNPDATAIPQFHHWEGLERVESSWKVGTFGSLNLTVGVRPNRNPAQNGMQLIFYENLLAENDDEATKKKRRLRKLGYLLMKNSSTGRPTSSLLGMFLDPTDRGRGMAKNCLAIWIWLCLKGSLFPVAGIIRKPLLSLILQHTFQFVPVPVIDGTGNGVLVQLCRDPTDDGAVVLYSPSLKNLEGAFSKRDLKQQNIKLSSEKPSTPGREVKIVCPLKPRDDLNQLEEICDRILMDGGWECELTSEQIRSVFLGLPMNVCPGEQDDDAREQERAAENNEGLKQHLLLGQNR